MERLEDLPIFYDLMAKLESREGMPLLFSEIGAHQRWPDRGVYFIFEPSEDRTTSGQGPRVVRVGTHATTTGSRSTLRQRLSAHRGNRHKPGGNHRGSIFRLLVGDALQLHYPNLKSDSWGQGASAPRNVRDDERAMEALVSERIGAMSLLWLPIEDAPGPGSLRVYVERNAIALLSNWNRAAADQPSAQWLGRHSSRQRVRDSGLWNNRYVDDAHDPHFLDTLAQLIES